MTALAVENERVIRRFIPRMTDLTPLRDRGYLFGCMVDCETTGLDPEKDAIIQLSVVPFCFSANGNIEGVGTALTYYEDPGTPIPAEITKITGITDADVRGKRIDEGEVSFVARDAAIVIAHNADFDRKFVEKRLSVFQALRWGCAYRDVPWKDEGYECSKLRCLMLEHANLDYDNHGAEADCYASLHLLSTALPQSSMRGLAFVLAAARVSHARIYAVGSPFEYKDVLKQRGYSWDAGKKVWFRDVIVGDEYQAEISWLANNALCHSPKSVSFNSKVRFSNRIGL